LDDLFEHPANLHASSSRFLPKRTIHGGLTSGHKKDARWSYHDVASTPFRPVNSRLFRTSGESQEERMRVFQLLTGEHEVLQGHLHLPY
jgi:hypothetical protein